MNKAEKEANKRYWITRGDDTQETSGIDMQRASDFIEGYHQAEKDLTDKAKTSSGWDGFFYGQGYKQAEKDNELTWEDLAFIRLAFDATEANIYLGAIKIQPMTKEYFQEVLKRFKDFKERKEK